MKTRYKFLHSYVNVHGVKILVWQSGPIPGDSRVEQVVCRADWFWNPHLTPPQLRGPYRRP